MNVTYSRRRYTSGCSWQCAYVMARRPAAVSRCSTGVLHTKMRKQTVTEHLLIVVWTVHLGSMMTMRFLPVRDMSTETHDGAVNSSLRHVRTHEINASSV